MNLINVTFALLALYLVSIFVGALFSNRDESFAQTLRRGFTTILTMAVLTFVILVMMEEPEFIDRVINALERVLTTY